MSKVFQHEQHEATRAAAEVIVRGRRYQREHKVNGGVLPVTRDKDTRYVIEGTPALRGLRAVGSIAYASIYTSREHMPEVKQPGWLVEWYHPRHGWLTCGRAMQGKTLADARALAKMPNHRVVVLSAGGGYVAL